MSYFVGILSGVRNIFLLSCPQVLSLLKEKVYSVSETPTQHTCGVTKTNKKLTPSLKKDT